MKLFYSKIPDNLMSSPDKIFANLKSQVKIAENCLTSPKCKNGILLVTFCWDEDDVHGNLDCNDITKVFQDSYQAESIRIVLEMKAYSSFAVFGLLYQFEKKIKTDQLVVIFYRFGFSNTVAMDPTTMVFFGIQNRMT